MDSSYKLPIQRIIVSSLHTLWTNRVYYSKALWIPTLFLVLIWATWYVYSDNIDVLIAWLFMLLYTLAYCIFAITCHRLVLIKNKFDFFNVHSYFSKRVILFFILVVYVYICISIIDMFPMAVIFNLELFSNLNINIGENDWLLFPVYIPGLYILGRICLVFPAKAIDEKANIKWSWEMTRNNGWRMFVIVGFYPWLLGMLIWLVWRNEASIFEDVIFSLLTLLTLVLEVIALSFTYKELVKHKAEELRAFLP